jgi:hypothetical protein
MRIEDVPLSTGPDALDEAVLLGRVLVAFGVDELERVLALDAAWEAAGLPEQGVTVHLVFRRGGVTVQEDRFSLDASGAGLRHADSAPIPDEETTLYVDVDDTPALRRFERLCAYLADQRVEADEIERRTGQPIPVYAKVLGQQVEMLSGVVDRRAANESDPVLTGIVDRLLESAGGWPLGLDPDAALAVRRNTDRVRSDGGLGTWSAAALLVVAGLPGAIADRLDGGGPAEFVRYFLFGLLEARVSPFQAVVGLAGKAVREGQLTALVDAGRDLLDEAGRLRDEAMDGPPSRDFFSWCLFRAQPYALAATHLLRIAAEAPADDQPATARLAAAADEVLTRLHDGILHQWSDFGDMRLNQEREVIRAARARGDETTVQLILRDGEFALRRPRSAREYLLS